MSLLREWDISEEELSLILNERPSLRGILLGFVAEYKLTQRWFQYPEITNLRRHSNHDRTSGADFSFTYKGVLITVQVKSLQTHSITFAPESESSPRAFRATFQCDASDRRKVTLPNNEAIETTCLVVGGFDLLAVNLFAALKEWRFAFAWAQELPRSTYKKYSEEQRRYLLASLMQIEWPLKPPFYPEPFGVLDRIVEQKKSGKPA